MFSKLCYAHKLPLQPNNHCVGKNAYFIIYKDIKMFLVTGTSNIFKINRFFQKQ